jgi:hypothetical protein
MVQTSIFIPFFKWSLCWEAFPILLYKLKNDKFVCVYILPFLTSTRFEMANKSIFEGGGRGWLWGGFIATDGTILANNGNLQSTEGSGIPHIYSFTSVTGKGRQRDAEQSTLDLASLKPEVFGLAVQGLHLDHQVPHLKESMN